MQPVHKDIFYPIFTEIIGSKRQELKEFMNVKNVNSCFMRDYISSQRFEQLQHFVKLDKSNDFSSVKEYVVDNMHSQIWLCKLNSHMNTSEFITDAKNKARIIEEQKLIYKIVNQ